MNSGPQLPVRHGCHRMNVREISGETRVWVKAVPVVDFGNEVEKIVSWNLKYPFINGCFNWMIPNP